MTIVRRIRPIIARRQAVITTRFVALAIFLGATPCQAQIVMQVENSTAAPGSTGAFNVFLTDTGGTFQIGGFGLDVSVPNVSGIQFSGATANTTPAYIFGTLQSPPFTFDTFPNTDTTVSDTDFIAPGFVTLTAGESVGLGNFGYSVASGTANGPITVSLVPGGTSLSDGNGNAVAFSSVDGTITVSPLPEPGTCFLCGLASLGALIVRRRARIR
jgi:hypothetical protein